MSLEKAKKYLENKGCMNWKKCATPRAGWMCAKRRKAEMIRHTALVGADACIDPYSVTGMNH